MLADTGATWQPRQVRGGIAVLTTRQNLPSRRTPINMNVSLVGLLPPVRRGAFTFRGCNLAMSRSFDPPNRLGPPPDLPADIAQICSDAERLTNDAVHRWAQPGEFENLPPASKVEYPTLYSAGKSWDVVVARQAVEKRLLALSPDLIDIEDSGSGPRCTIHDPIWRNARFAAEMAALAVLGLLPEGGPRARAAQRWRVLVTMVQS
ncbi:hypothetical protein [Microbacterium sp.]|uniref:hypothetical protein n=1 Tax=Microbacterium sp. TaxID=51671 RepID=UPI0031FF0C87|nr:hypothetical protein [Microbacterium sp.]